MDTKYISKIINTNTSVIEDLACDVAEELLKILDNFEFENNDDLRLIVDRIHVMFMARFNFEFGARGMFKKMKCDKTGR